MPKHAQLLLVEDELNLGATLKEMLEGEHYVVTWAQTKKDALADIKAMPFDVALLDVQLPDGNGFDIAQILKDTPILFLTAVSEPEERVRGLQLGAEDYIVKPFHFKELLLRIQNAMRRGKPKTGEQIQLGNNQIDCARFTINNAPISTREMKLIQLLYDRRETVVSRDEILNHVWPRESFPSARTVDNFILKLRKLLDRQEHIVTIRGAGYKLQELP